MQSQHQQDTSLKTRLLKTFAYFFVERPGRQTGVAAYPKKLRAQGEQLVSRFSAVRETPKTVALLNHITTIERWSQNRLRAFLGHPVDITEESDDFHPRATTMVAALDAFQSTRAESVALAEQVGALPATDRQVPHNQFGPFSLTSWLHYIYAHTRDETLWLLLMR